MIEHGNVQSTVKPEELIVDENSVWVTSDIKEVTEEEFEGFEYHLVQYTKDEYILHTEEQRKLDKMENDLAIVELAETLIGGAL